MVLIAIVFLISISCGSGSPPSWFVNDLELQFQWFSDGSSRLQCGNSKAFTGTRSASVNSWTGYYRDDTDGRGGGCQMQWRIKPRHHLSGVDYNSVQICFRYTDDDKNGQCGGKNPTCAPLGEWTSYYRDDTDNRSGGCWLSWKLVIASHLSWAKKVRFDYNWKHDENAGQCGGGAATFISAEANQWTAGYRDDTDGRAGGCQMRWRITALA